MTCYIAFPNYPAAAMPVLPMGWHDASWRHDACPRYTRDDGRVSIWMDYPDAADRAFQGYPRFAVVIDDNDGAVYGTDDWTDALAAADAVLPPAPPVLTLV
jgi:hypothetical protein